MYFHLAGIATTITVNVHTPKNFPVDLYYLTDVSRSIKKESIKSLGHLLGKQLVPFVVFRVFTTSGSTDQQACVKRFWELHVKLLCCSKNTLFIKPYEPSGPLLPELIPVPVA